MYIVFDKEDAQALEKSFELDEKLASEILIEVDDWSYGPLKNMNIEDGKITRAEWLAGLGIQLPEKDAVQLIKEKLDSEPESTAIIWVAPNNRDVCGYYHLVSELQSYKGRVSNIWLNNLPFINEKMQVFYPNYLKEILPAEFVKARKLELEITSSTFETDPDEWTRLREENDLLRISDGGKKVSGKPVDFFDKEIMSLMQNDWQKVSRLLHAVKSNDHPSRTFLLWRIREMINTQRIEAKGDWPSNENFDIKKIQVQPQSESSDE